MSWKTNKKGNAVSVFFTVLLFLVLVLCVLFTVSIDSRAYESINIRSNANYTDSTVLGYITNKVCQDDWAGVVNVVDVDGTQVLEARQETGESEYVTWIYWDDGSIRELLIDTFSDLGLADGLEVLECRGPRLSRESRLLHMKTAGEGGGSLELSLRSGKLKVDE